MYGGDIAALPKVDGSSLADGVELALVAALTVVTVMLGVLVVAVLGACRNKYKK